MSWCNLFHDFEKVFIEFVTILLLFFMFWSFGHPRARGISAPRPRIESAPPALEGEVLTAGAPGTSHEFIWSLMYLHLYLRMVFTFSLFISLQKVYRCIHIHTKHKHIYTHIGTLTHIYEGQNKRFSVSLLIFWGILCISGPESFVVLNRIKLEGQEKLEKLREAKVIYIRKDTNLPLGELCHCFSAAKCSLTLCNPMDCSTPSSSVLHYLHYLEGEMTIHSSILVPELHELYKSWEEGAEKRQVEFWRRKRGKRLGQL